MATYLGSCGGASSRSLRVPVPEFNHSLLLVHQERQQASRIGSKKLRSTGGLTARNSRGGDSYLDMWKKSVERDRKNFEFQRIVKTSAASDGGDIGKSVVEELQKKSQEFQRILEVPTEERDRIQRMQVIDRAGAAIAAARAILQESNGSKLERAPGASVGGEVKGEGGEAMGELQEGNRMSGAPIVCFLAIFIFEFLCFKLMLFYCSVLGFSICLLF